MTTEDLKNAMEAHDEGLRISICISVFYPAWNVRSFDDDGECSGNRWRRCGETYQSLSCKVCIDVCVFNTSLTWASNCSGTGQNGVQARTEERAHQFSQFWGFFLYYLNSDWYSYFIRTSLLSFRFHNELRILHPHGQVWNIYWSLPAT